MKVIRHTRPRIEPLEARDCPALTLRYLPTALILSGRPTGALLIKGQVSGLFNVSDNGKSLGNYNLDRNLIVQLSSRPSDLEIDLNAKTIGGNVILNLGNGYAGPASTSVSVDVFDSTNSGANVRGSVTIVRGNGREMVGLGGFTDGGGTFQTGAVTVRGDVTVAARSSGGLLQDKFQAGAGTRIGGSVSLIQVDAVSLGEQNVGGVSVGKNVSVTTTGATSGTTVTMLGNFGGHVTVNGLASTSMFNAFTLETQSPGVGSSVGGNVSVAFGQARLGNIYQILADAGNPFTSSVGGNVTLTSRNAAAAAPLTDFYLMEGEVSGSLTVNLGFGDSDFSFRNAGGGINASVGGNILIQGSGGGATTIGTAGNLFEGDVGGSVSILLGNGTNNTSIQSAISGRLTYRGGNGTDTVELAPSAAQTYLVDMLFGTGINTLMLTSQVTLNGVVRGSGGNNTFLQNGATLLPTLFLINFP